MGLDDDFPSFKRISDDDCGRGRDAFTGWGDIFQEITVLSGCRGVEDNRPPRSSCTFHVNPVLKLQLRQLREFYFTPFCSNGNGLRIAPHVEMLLQTTVAGSASLPRLA